MDWIKTPKKTFTEEGGYPGGHGLHRAAGERRPGRLQWQPAAGGASAWRARETKASEKT